MSIADSPQLGEYIGLDIITSQGDTILGADNKAGVAEISRSLTHRFKNFKIINPSVTRILVVI